jgi:hypothetical protein
MQNKKKTHTHKTKQKKNKQKKSIPHGKERIVGKKKNNSSKTIIQCNKKQYNNHPVIPFIELFSNEIISQYMKKKINKKIGGFV